MIEMLLCRSLSMLVRLRAPRVKQRYLGYEFSGYRGPWTHPQLEHAVVIERSDGLDACRWSFVANPGVVMVEVEQW